MWATCHPKCRVALSPLTSTSFAYPLPRVPQTIATPSPPPSFLAFNLARSYAHDCDTCFKPVFTMDSSPSHFPGGLVTGSGTATPASSLLSSSTAANSPALTTDAASATRPTPDTSMDVSMTASDALNPLKRTIDQVDGDGGVSEGEIVVGPPPLDGASLGTVAPAQEMGTATTTAIELPQPDTTTKPALNKRGRPPGSKTVYVWA